ncbi:MAG TPA: M23 family metallopeptidase [Sphingomicrobium sp.]|nr:M23 family metallopeptidase [Sphingomicrobium sp.]
MRLDAGLDSSGAAAAPAVARRAGRAPMLLMGGLSATAIAMMAAPLLSTRLDASVAQPSNLEQPQPYLGRLLDEREPVEAIHERPPAAGGIARFRGRLNEGLAAALENGGVPSDVAARFMGTIADRSRGLDIGPDDHFDLVVEHGTPSGPSLIYAALDRVGASDVQLIRVAGAWVDAGGGDGRSARPVPGRLTSRYGLRRHPLLGYSRMHRGVDFAAAFGAPVVAASAGRVVGAGWAGGYGRQVRIVHGDGLSSSYSHLSRFAVGPGRYVGAGQVIGYAGSSGLSTGPHVHYEVRRNGIAVDPLGTALKGGASLDPKTQAQLRERIAILLNIPPQPRG